MRRCLVTLALLSLATLTMADECTFESQVARDVKSETGLQFNDPARVAEMVACSQNPLCGSSWYGTNGKELTQQQLRDVADLQAARRIEYEGEAERARQSQDWAAAAAAYEKALQWTGEGSDYDAKRGQLSLGAANSHWYAADQDRQALQAALDSGQGNRADALAGGLRQKWLDAASNYDTASRYETDPLGKASDLGLKASTLFNAGYYTEACQAAQAASAAAKPVNAHQGEETKAALVAAGRPCP